MSSKTTGPLFTKPPAVMGRCCSSNCAGCGGPVASPPVAGACASWAAGAAEWPEPGAPVSGACDRSNAGAFVKSNPRKREARGERRMAKSIRAEADSRIDRKVEKQGTREQGNEGTTRQAGNAEVRDFRTNCPAYRGS